MPVTTTPGSTLTQRDLETAMRHGKPDRVAIIYSKIDGRIEFVATHCINPRRTIDVTMRTLMPTADERYHELIWVPYENGEVPSPKHHRVIVDVNGNFVAIKPIRQFGFSTAPDEDEQERAHSLAQQETEMEINTELLKSNLEVVMHVLDQILDMKRLIQYQLAEISGQNRPELQEYFKKRGL